jgi:hypothetical protein
MEIFLAQEGPFPEVAGGDAGFSAALDALRRVKGAPLLDRVDTGPARVGTMDRVRPTGARIARDTATGSWMVAAGTWFHPDVRGSNRTEQLLQAYLAGRDRFWDDLDGYFGIVLLDGASGRLLVATDIVGCFHVYYRFRSGFTIVSTSSLALAAIAPRDYDPVSLFEFVAKGSIFEDRTPYRDIRKCRPGTVHEFRDGREIARRRYWRIADLPIGSLAGDRAADALRDALVDVARRLPDVSQRPLTDLTGGIDSRTLVAVFLATGVPVFTTVSGDDGDADVKVSRRIAEELHLPHRHNRTPEDWPGNFRSWVDRCLPFTEGEYDLFEFSGILRTHWTVLDEYDLSVNGSAGGTSRGTWWEIAFPRVGTTSELDTIRLARERFAVPNYEAGIFAPGVAFDLTPHFTRIIEEANEGLERQPNTTKIDSAYLMLRLQRWQGRISSSTTQLWGCLSPFACRKPLEAALCTVPGDRAGSRMIRSMLQRMNPKLAAFRLATGYPASPPSLLSLRTHAVTTWDLGRRALRKGLRLTGLARRTPAAPPVMHRCLTALWEDPEVRDLLDAARMTFRDLYDQRALRAFFDASRRPGFGGWRQHGRIYTLERAAGPGSRPFPHPHDGAIMTRAIRRACAYLVATVLVAVLGSPGTADGRVLVADPGATSGTPGYYRDLVTQLVPGDTLSLPAGTYGDRLSLTGVQGQPGAWITVLGPASGAPAVITTSSLCCNTVQLGDTWYVAIRNLTVDSVGLNGIDGINAGGNYTHDILIENCTLIGQNHDQSVIGISTKSPAWNWTIRGNTILGAGTGMYLGNSTGSFPFINGLIEGNLVMDTIGYNMEIKWQLPYDSFSWVSQLPPEPHTTIIRDNVWIKSKGGWDPSIVSGVRPTVLVGGFPDSGVGSGDRYDIYDNFFYENPDESLFQASGRTSVHDNVFVGASSGNYSLYFVDHDLNLKMAHVYNNTIYTTTGRGIGFGSTAREGDAVVGNLIFADDRPLYGSITNQSDNVVAPSADAPQDLVQPSLTLGQMDFYPLASCAVCSGTALDLSAFSGESDFDRDFNGTAKGSFLFRGAYAGSGVNPGWRLDATKRPLGTSGGTVDTVAPAAVRDLISR